MWDILNFIFNLLDCRRSLPIIPNTPETDSDTSTFDDEKTSRNRGDNSDNSDNSTELKYITRPRRESVRISD